MSPIFTNSVKSHGEQHDLHDLRAPHGLQLQMDFSKEQISLLPESVLQLEALTNQTFIKLDNLQGHDPSLHEMQPNFTEHQTTQPNLAMPQFFIGDRPDGSFSAEIGCKPPSLSQSSQSTLIGGRMKGHLL